MSETELLLRANDCQANPATRVIIKFMRDPGLILAEIEHRRFIDTSYVVPVRGVVLDEKTPNVNRTLGDKLSYNLVDITLARNIFKGKVVGLIIFHTYIIFCGGIKSQSIVQFGS